MKDNSEKPFGCAFWFTIIIVDIVVEIIGIKNKLSIMDRHQLSGYCVGVAALIYGIIYYIVKKYRK